MKRFDQWTLEAIRDGRGMMNWLEERRYEWIPLVADAIQRILAGSTILLLTDNDRRWFGEYIVSSINGPLKNRPFIPLYNLREITPYLDSVKGSQDIELLFDMFSISFDDRFFLWYVGRATPPYIDIARWRGDSLLWILDENLQNSFTLSSDDDLLDIKLIQLFKLFDRSLNAAMFGEVLFL
ncbi:MAG: hypothetical protein GXO19_06210 [Epsilonproteobacteria bacterium]|nr:hypothetical protein [Campylobacterota bacterium]NPA57309.1 hypothetical protein [Campylobacterota bacterium]